MKGRLHPQERIERFTAAGWWTDETWDSLLGDQVAQRPDATAVVDAPNRAAFMDGDPARWTWAELDRRVGNLAGSLEAEGIKAGDVVAVQLPNSTELVATLLAIARIGAVASPLPVQFREFELEQLTSLAGAVAHVTATRVLDRPAAEIATKLIPAVGSLRTVLAFGPEPPPGVVPVGGDGGGRAFESETRDLDPAHAVTLCWTSGTESTPKGVPRTHHDWIAIARATVDGVALGPDDVLLNPFPMVNMAGIGGMLLPWLMTGGTLVQHHPFDLPTFLRQVEEERVTYTVAPPALLTMLLGMDELLASADLSSLRIIGSGSAPLSPAMVKGWSDRFGIDVTNFFGSNEGVALLGDPKSIPDPEQRARFFPRASAVPGLETRLVDLDSGEEITDAGVPGELLVAGPTVVAGYLGGVGADAFLDGGWFRTGDVFELVAAASGTPSLYRFVDRAKDLVIRGGMNISPAEIEGLLGGHPKLAEVAIVGTPHETLGETVTAVAVPRDAADPPQLEELVAHLREKQIASYKLPERIEIVDALPKNPVGKVLKRELRAQLAAGRPA